MPKQEGKSQRFVFCLKTQHTRTDKAGGAENEASVNDIINTILDNFVQMEVLKKGSVAKMEKLFLEIADTMRGHTISIM